MIKISRQIQSKIFNYISLAFYQYTAYKTPQSFVINLFPVAFLILVINFIPMLSLQGSYSVCDAWNSIENLLAFHIWN